MTISPAPVSPQQDPPISDRTYAIVPRAAITDLRLSDRAYRLYTLLDARLMGRAQPVKVTTLAADIGATVRSTERALAELVALGYITRSRTRAVSVTALVNPVRSAKETDRSATGGGSDPTPVADTSRSTSSRNKDINNRGTAPARSGASALTETSAAEHPLDPYLQAASEGAGVDISLNRKTQALLGQIAARGVSPEQLRVQVAEWPRISWSGEQIISKGGFYVDVVLRGIAEGWQPPPAERPAAPETPVPPRIEDLYAHEPCHHGDPRGQRACALCRQEWLDQRADAAEVGVQSCRAALTGATREEIPA